MPIYEFKCRECGDILEVLVSSYSASNTPACLTCGSHNLEKLISVPSLLKGEPRHPGTTYCGREERCDAPPCSSGAGCCRH